VLPFDPDRIADQLRIGALQPAAFLPPSVYLFRTVFPWLFACHPASDRRRPWCASDGSSRMHGIVPIALSKVSSRVS